MRFLTNIKRPYMSEKDRWRRFNHYNGICDICDLPIDPASEWDISHRNPWVISHNNNIKNTPPVHRDPCHREQTAKTDIPLIAKCKRIEAKNNGFYQSSRPMAGSIRSGWKVPMNGKPHKR